VAALVYVIRFGLLSFTTAPGWIIAIQTMHSLSFGIFFFTSIRYVQQVVPDEYRASGQALFTVVWSSVAGLLSGLVGGWAFEQLDGQWLYRIAASLALAAAVGFYLMHVWEERGALPRRFTKS
jgi:PPP family 3-phenylpropionic acid transporter